MISSVLDEQLRADIVAETRKTYEIEAAQHEPSGKLSAGQLGKPLLEQVLKVIGVPQKPVDDYALGLFRRGNSVEKEILELIQPDEVQKEAEYKDCIGFIDAIKNGRVIEIKSVKNSMVCYIDPENHTRQKNRTTGKLEPQYGGVKRSHALQGALYALSEGKGEFTIIYVAADDLRTFPHVIQTAEMKPEVDKIINEVKHQLALGVLPKFEAKEDWQANAQYSGYPEWISLEPDDAMIKLKNQYPLCYQKLTGELDGKNQ